MRGKYQEVHTALHRFNKELICSGKEVPSDCDRVNSARTNWRITTGLQE